METSTVDQSSRLATTKETMFGTLQRHEILTLIANFFIASDYIESYDALHKKVNLLLDPLFTSQQLRNDVIDGEWEKVVNVLTDMVDSLPLKESEATMLKQIVSCVVHEQHYLELVNRDQITEAVTLLRTKLTQFQKSGVTMAGRNVESLCLLLIELDKWKWHSRLHWCAEEYPSRLEVLNHLRFLLHALVHRGITPHRLKDLLDLGIREEMSRCVVPHHQHNASALHHPVQQDDTHRHRHEASYVLMDECTQQRLPSQLCMAFNQWHFYQCTFSPRGKYLAALAHPILADNTASGDSEVQQNRTSRSSSTLPTGHHVLLLFARSVEPQARRDSSNSSLATQQSSTFSRNRPKWVLHKMKAFQDPSGSPTSSMSLEWRFDDVKLVVASAHLIFLFTLPSLTMEQFPRPLRPQPGEWKVMHLVPRTDLMLFTCENGHCQVMDTQWQQFRTESDACTFRAKMFATHLYHDNANMNGTFSYHVRVFVTDFSYRVRCYTWHLSHTLEQRMFARILHQQILHHREEEAEARGSSSRSHNSQLEDGLDMAEDGCTGENGISPLDSACERDSRGDYLSGSYPSVARAAPYDFTQSHQQIRRGMDPDGEVFTQPRAFSTNALPSLLPLPPLFRPSGLANNSSQQLVASLIRAISGSSYSLPPATSPSGQRGAAPDAHHPMSSIDFPLPRELPSWVLEPSPVNVLSAAAHLASTRNSTMDAGTLGGATRLPHLPRPSLLPRPGEMPSSSSSWASIHGNHVPTFMPPAENNWLGHRLLASHLYEQQLSSSSSSSPSAAGATPPPPPAGPSVATREESLTCEPAPDFDLVCSPSEIMDLQVSADGQHLFTLHRQCVRMWNACNGNLIRELVPLTKSTTGEKLPPVFFDQQKLCLCGGSSEYVAVLSTDHRVIFWNTGNPLPIHELRLGLRPAAAAATSSRRWEPTPPPEGMDMSCSTFSSSTSNSQEDASTATSSSSRRMEEAVTAAPPEQIAWNPAEPSLLAVISRDHSLQLWCSQSWSPSVHHHQLPIQSNLFSPRKRFAATVTTATMEDGDDVSQAKRDGEEESAGGDVIISRATSASSMKTSPMDLR